MEFGSGLMNVGYGIHYPVRHGQVENWVGLPQVWAENSPTDIRRITWSAFGLIQSSNTFVSNRKTTIFYSRSLYVPQLVATFTTENV